MFEASRAFIVLGNMAKDAVPALVKMYDENVTAESRSAIEDALAWIGPAAKPAIPLLMRASTNANPGVRANALWAMGEIHAEPELCIPRLAQALNDTDDWARLSAAHALGMFRLRCEVGGSGTDGVDQPLRNFQRGSFRYRLQLTLEARNALKKIDPHVAWATRR